MTKRAAIYVRVSRPTGKPSKIKCGSCGGLPNVGAGKLS